MIQKKSVNVSYKLLIIAVLEILLFNGFFWLRRQFSEREPMPEFDGILGFMYNYFYPILISVFLTAIIVLGFLMKKATNPVSLRNWILWLRRIVFAYIGILFLYHGFAFAHGYYDGLTDDGNKSPAIIVLVIALIVLLLILTFSFWLFNKIYTRFIYRNILKLFKINYDDLVILEESKKSQIK